MARPSPAESLAKRRQEHEDAMEALGLNDAAKLALRAAASALAKAHTIDALETFARSRRADPESLAPN